MRYYPDNEPEKKKAYREKLQTLDDKQLFAETKDKLWFSGFSADDLISCYHWQRDFTYDEWSRRSKPEKYEEAQRIMSNGN